MRSAKNWKTAVRRRKETDMDVSAYFMLPEIRTARKALCIQPHPDDIEIGMGGTAAALAAGGCLVT